MFSSTEKQAAGSLRYVRRPLAACFELNELLVSTLAAFRDRYPQYTCELLLNKQLIRPSCIVRWPGRVGVATKGVKVLAIARERQVRSRFLQEGGFGVWVRDEIPGLTPKTKWC